VIFWCNPDNLRDLEDSYDEFSKNMQVRMQFEQLYNEIANFSDSYLMCCYAFLRFPFQFSGAKRVEPLTESG
jgi:hypothetical protein